MSSENREVVYAGFDEALWKAGVAGGAFSGTKDPDAVWYLLSAGDKKVAIASATPGPGELTNIAYYVDPEQREKGYGTKIASHVSDRHEKASFLMMKSNGGSIKVALAALRSKFSMTMGHNVVRLTKEAGLFGGKKSKPSLMDIMRQMETGEIPALTYVKKPKHGDPHLQTLMRFTVAQRRNIIRQATLGRGDPLVIPSDVKLPKTATDIKKSPQDTVGTALESKIHESFTVAADRIFRSGMVSVNERKALSGAIGDMLNRFRSKVDADVYGRKMTDNAHEHLKSAVSEQAVERVIQTRFIQTKAKSINSSKTLERNVGRAAEVVARKPVTAISREDLKKALATKRYVQSNLPAGTKGGDIHNAIRAAEATKSHQMQLPG